MANVSVQKAMPLDDTLSLLANAELVVSNDTGIRNLAICCPTTTVGIFYSTVPYRYWPRYGKHDAVFQADGSIPSVNAVQKSIKAILKP